MGDSGHGGIAQLVEHLLCKQGVIGSSPIISTKTLTLKPEQSPAKRVCEGEEK